LETIVTGLVTGRSDAGIVGSICWPTTMVTRELARNRRQPARPVAVRLAQPTPKPSTDYCPINPIHPFMVALAA
jgi:hypothetical protein